MNEVYMCDERNEQTEEEDQVSQRLIDESYSFWNHICCNSDSSCFTNKDDNEEELDFLFGD
jgi:hypothetical protein